MRIVCIFTDQLFAFHFNGQEENELHRLLTLWNDTSHLYQFVKENKSDIPKNKSVQSLIFELNENANKIDDTLKTISNDSEIYLEEFFKPLDNKEYRVV